MQEGGEVPRPSQEGLLASGRGAELSPLTQAQPPPSPDPSLAPTAQVKFRLLFQLYQMLSLFGLCFQVDWPSEYEAVTQEVGAVVNLDVLGPMAVSLVLSPP